ncbi:nad dependent epimerase [Phlyctema vagabunda]|uniref:Nad dependent epimerase n=1 Tax=Phlyctema vagabunda TaxID=108571 RepID=A0ABR4PV85_9HELO
MTSEDSREVSMEVLVLGLCRTGTMSTKKALEQLGYKGVYHAATVFMTPGHADQWTAALEAKYEGKGAPFTKEQFDAVLGQYSAVTDIPAVCFSPELIALYPDAKIILTTRSVDSWYESMMNTIWASQVDPLRPIQRLFYNAHLASLARMFDKLFHVYFYGDFEKWGKRVFVEHNDRVRTVAPQDRFLEFQVKEGWEPLCKFLGKDVPEASFPRVNDTLSWRKDFKTGEAWTKVKRIGTATVVVSAAAGIMWKRSSGKA